MTDREAAKKRAAMLKALRTEYSETVAQTQALLKEQTRIQKLICSTLREKAMSVPEIAAEVSMPTNEVLWYMTAYKKYDLVAEDGICGDYILYKMIGKK